MNTIQIGRARKLTPLTEDTNFRLTTRSDKSRPLDHLSFSERTAAGYLEKGGFWPDYVKKVAEDSSQCRAQPWAYQLWLFNHQ